MQNHQHLTLSAVSLFVEWMRWAGYAVLISTVLIQMSTTARSHKLSMWQQITTNVAFSWNSELLEPMTLVLQYNWSQQIASRKHTLHWLLFPPFTLAISPSDLSSILLMPCSKWATMPLTDHQKQTRLSGGYLGSPFSPFDNYSSTRWSFSHFGIFFQVSHPSNILVISHTSHIANEICIGKLWWGGVWEVCFPLTLIDQRRGLVCWEEGCPSQPKSDFRSFLASSWRFAGRCHATPPSHKPASK